MMYWGYGYGWPMMFWGLLCMVLLVLGIWALVRWMSRPTGNDTRMRVPSSEPSAMEILRRRYAREEIDTATFEQMRERLEASREEQSLSGK
jgi:putative membrane protein